MIIGTIFTGKMKTLNEQCIETKFFAVGIPLIPLKSIFVTDSKSNSRSGIEIGMNGESIFKGYASYISLAVGTFGVLSSNSENPNKAYMGLLLLLISLYFFLGFGSSNEEENKVRVLYEKAIGVSILPRYFDAENLNPFLAKLISQTNNIVGSDWLDVIEKKRYNEQQLPVLFALMGFLSYKEKTTKNITIYNTLKKEFEEIINSKNM